MEEKFAVAEVEVKVEVNGREKFVNIQSKIRDEENVFVDEAIIRDDILFNLEERIVEFGEGGVRWEELRKVMETLESIMEEHNDERKKAFCALDTLMNRQHGENIMATVNAFWQGWFWFYSDVFDEEEYGEKVAENHCMNISVWAKPFFDFAGLGKMTAEREHGEFTDFGYIVEQ